MRMLRENTVCIAVDYQDKLIPAIDKKEELLKNSAILLSGLKALGVPVMVSQQYTKGLGETVPEIKAALGEFEPLEKTSFSVYDDDNKKVIDDMNRKNVILCGTEAHVCVLQTVIDLKEAGYNVFYVEDCVGSRTERARMNGVRRAMTEGAHITSYEAVLFELLRSAKAAEFKTISGIVK